MPKQSERENAMTEHNRPDPITEAFARCAALGGGTDEVWQIDLDRCTYSLGQPGLWDGAIFAAWSAR
jgi:hypothetical protein